jgi:hypothetical protein
VPGAYAHITVVNEFRNRDRLDGIPGFPHEAIIALLRWFKYAELGAVSPDYPYLAIGDSGAAEWADVMHYTRTGRIVQAGVKMLLEISGERQLKCLAWLFGYASHVTADVTIHPVVEMKVGPYAENKEEHRTCEMHQDAYIFQRINVAEVGISDHLESGIGACISPDDKDKMDPDIVTFWGPLLHAVHPEKFAANPPNIDKWHERFNEIVDAISSAGNHLLPFARHVAAGIGLIYPSADQIDRQFIDGLRVPNAVMGYDDIFEKAIINVGSVWADIATGVYGGSSNFITRLGDWNLDTGRDGNGNLIFWG